ncbi:MAG: homoserine dehydrogenase [Clostridiales bacterium]|nr:homoserine dehydrogenase [Clostridiales bacterium]MBS5878043.1 homoserine dehydrogenase [Clostridiales bacterium]MDU0939275.1 homoserine dehydrogenase [Clostridiales bacterium]MDU1042293.1 homoserine dehydrogenase [Clostridiales bacterium]MDU3490112.1 homoserine dehydrogenase [Clostridiales bacterium]
MAKIAILGYGVVGSGVFDVLTRNSDIVSSRAGQDVEIKYVLDLRDFPGNPVEKYLVHDIDMIINDPEIEVVVETMGGEEPAHTFVKRALEAGKSVCTSNKAIVAAFGTELLKTADEKGVRFLFGASVGGGIPIIRPIKEALTADHIERMEGILNGTTNYILTKMSQEGAEFEDALKEAQDNGYAERDPGADIEGFDSCRKIAILASLVSGKTVPFERIYTEGITKITSKDLIYAAKLNRKIKLIARFELEDNRLKAVTAPFLIDISHPLYSVDDVVNGVTLHGDFVGDVVFQGAGAGRYPTASAVAADVVDAVKHNRSKFKLLWNDTELVPEEIINYDFRYFVRLKNTESARELRAAVFFDASAVNIGDEAEVAFVTGLMKEGDFFKAVEDSDLISYIRVS